MSRQSCDSGRELACPGDTCRFRLLLLLSHIPKHFQILAFGRFRITRADSCRNLGWPLLCTTSPRIARKIAEQFTSVSTCMHSRTSDRPGRTSDRLQTVSLSQSKWPGAQFWKGAVLQAVAESHGIPNKYDVTVVSKRHLQEEDLRDIGGR